MEDIDSALFLLVPIIFTYLQPLHSWYNFVILVGSMLNVHITKNLYKPYLQLSQDIYYDLLLPSGTTLLSLRQGFCLLT